MNGNGYSVYWDFPDPMTGAITRKHRHFATRPAAESFMVAQAKLNPWITNRKLLERPVQTDEQFDTVGRDNADVLNRRRLVELMLQHNITIPAKQYDKWRPTEEKTGRIDGVADGLTCIMTDGLQGYFTREEREPLIGHVNWFKWDVPDISYVPYIDEHGQEKFFKQVKDQGAPSAYYRRPRKPAPIREKKVRVKKAHVPMTSDAALDLIKQMTSGNLS